MMIASQGRPAVDPRLSSWGTPLGWNAGNPPSCDHAKTAKSREIAAAFGEIHLAKELLKRMEALIKDIREAQAWGILA